MSQPMVAVALVTYLVFMFFHGQLGLQVVIEDYVHGKGSRTACIILMNLFCALFGFTGLFAVAKIAFSV